MFKVAWDKLGEYLAAYVGIHLTGLVLRRLGIRLIQRWRGTTPPPAEPGGDNERDRKPPS